MDSLGKRAILALALMVGFYVLGFAAVAALFVLADWAARQALPAFLVISTVFVAIGVAVALVPRPDRFVPPGPVLTRGEHPRLFALLEEVAAATGQAMPRDVFLVAGVDAAVTHRGGIMGLGSRRVMSIGLELLPLLRVSQFRAIIAHEFGHYYSGDLALGPWIYKTEAGLRRTMEQLTDGASVRRLPFLLLVQLPFIWYFRLFLRVTATISRHEEFAADLISARVAGRKASIAMLLAAGAGGYACEDYWEHLLGPLFRMGYRPPIAEGLGRFCRFAPAVDKARRQLEDDLESEVVSPYTSHPPLRERLAALVDLPDREPHTPDPYAITLLDDIETVETRYIGRFVDLTQVPGFRPATWEALMQFRGVVPLPELTDDADEESEFFWLGSTAQQSQSAGPVPDLLQAIGEPSPGRT